MKTFSQFIQEKWVADYPKRDKVVPIYENPSSKDLIDLNKSGLVNGAVRFCAVAATKKIYVWNGMEMIHDDAINKLVKEKIITRVQYDNLNLTLCGECKLIDGRLSFAQNKGMDSYFAPLMHTVKNPDSSSIDDFLPMPYESFSSLLKDLTNIIERYKWVGKFIDEYDTKSSPAILLNAWKSK